ncbi:MAG: dethiobiotin synthase [Rickettsiales bacterium]|nr:dethiobiotin synthase [Rickettsiales bacterium]
MLDSKIYFIAGVGTNIGKTFLVEKLCRNLSQSTAIKPIASGFNDDDKNSDTAKILTALNLEISKKNLDDISPWRFEEAVSPHFAAKNSATKIDFTEVKNFCLQKISQAQKSKKFLFIEAAGGIMTPINEEKTFLDLVAELKIPILLVTANYLGAISHTLCAAEILKSRKLTIEKIIVNKELPTLENQRYCIIETIKNFSSITTISLSEFSTKLS